MEPAFKAGDRVRFRSFYEVPGRRVETELHGAVGTVTGTRSGGGSTCWRPDDPGKRPVGKEGNGFLEDDWSSGTEQLEPWAHPIGYAEYAVSWMMAGAAAMEKPRKRKMSRGKRA